MREHKFKSVDKRGRIERIEYLTTDQNGDRIQKYANVYVPYGYPEKGKYNILYLMHGGGGNADAWLDDTCIKNSLDNTFANGEAEPFIVVFPTFYNMTPTEARKNGINQGWEGAQILFFQKELRYDLVPAVESHYHTYAEGITESALQASRQHRAFSGFSMGSCTTWYVFLNHLDIFSRFAPLSGDCWVLEPLGGSKRTKETVDILEKQAKAYNGDFKIFAATGRQDIAWPNLTPQMEEMKTRTDIFTYSDDLAEGNLHYYVKENAVHEYWEVYQYVYGIMPYLFA